MGYAREAVYGVALFDYISSITTFVMGAGGREEVGVVDEGEVMLRERERKIRRKRITGHSGIKTRRAKQRGVRQTDRDRDRDRQRERERE